MLFNKILVARTSSRTVLQFVSVSLDNRNQLKIPIYTSSISFHIYYFYELYTIHLWSAKLRQKERREKVRYNTYFRARVPQNFLSLVRPVASEVYRLYFRSRFRLKRLTSLAHMEGLIIREQHVVVTVLGGAGEQ